MKRNKLVAYFIGAGVAGTLIILPYTYVAIARSRIPEMADFYMPYFLVPVIWGLWNLLHTFLHRLLSIGIWGAILGFILGLVGLLFQYYVNNMFAGTLLGSLFVGVLFFTAFYYVFWYFIIGSLNKALGVDR